VRTPTRVLRKLQRTAVPAGATVAYTGRKDPEDKYAQASTLYWCGRFPAQARMRLRALIASAD
jgi:hypothetical protein